MKSPVTSECRVIVLLSVRQVESMVKRSLCLLTSLFGHGCGASGLNSVLICRSVDSSVQ